MKKLIIIFSLIVLLSCKETTIPVYAIQLVYQNVQPENDSELQQFPNRFIGSYKKDSVKSLIIDIDKIIETNVSTTKIHKSEKDSLINSFSKNELLNVTFKKVKDSIFVKYVQKDTLFYFSNINKAKRVHGNLVLNYNDKNLWQSQFFIFDKNKLQIKKYFTKTDLKLLDSISKIKSLKIDSITFICNPTRKEMLRFLKLKSNKYQEEYTKN